MTDTPKSGVPGVSYDKRTKQWVVQLDDRIATSNAGKPVKFYKTFRTLEEAKAACARERARLAREFEAEVISRWEADPTLRGLQRAPADASLATPKTAYWHVDGNSKYVPYRAVKSGRQYRRACVECDPSKAKLAVPGADGATTHCVAHGGGVKCEHGVLKCDPCPKCLTVEQVIATGKCCIRCFGRLGYQRLRDGSEMCAQCDAERAMRSEHLMHRVLNELVPEKPDAVEHDRYGDTCDRVEGNPAFRKPDRLYVVRAADDARVVGFVGVENDEDSHADNHGKKRAEAIECELGKVTDQYESNLDLMRREDEQRELHAARPTTLTKKFSAELAQWRPLPATRRVEGVRKELGAKRLVPQLLIKFNPDAYNGPGTHPIASRWAALADTVVEAMEEMRAGTFEEGDGLVVTVDFQYYHSKASDSIEAHRAQRDAMRVRRVGAPVPKPATLKAAKAAHEKIKRDVAARKRMGAQHKRKREAAEAAAEAADE